MVTTNVIYRVFHISVSGSKGTCFTIDVDRRQYLVTSRHLVERFEGSGRIRIYHEKQWKDLDVDLVGHCTGEVDVSVLAAKLQLSPPFELEPTSAGLAYGQEVYFLGFPYGMAEHVGDLNRDFPMPFIKKAIVSCILFKDNDVQVVLLDGHNNPGFSGAPVVFAEPNRRNYKVASVICGFRATEEPIFEDGRATPFVYKSNTGIVVSYGIKHAVDLIKGNPIGYEMRR